MTAKMLIAVALLITIGGIAFHSWRYRRRRAVRGLDDVLFFVFLTIALSVALYWEMT